ncbi:hypothetical protein [Paeniglutamicibacter antarcticus]
MGPKKEDARGHPDPESCNPSIRCRWCGNETAQAADAWRGPGRSRTPFGIVLAQRIETRILILKVRNGAKSTLALLTSSMASTWSFAYQTLLPSTDLSWPTAR